MKIKLLLITLLLHFLGSAIAQQKMELVIPRGHSDAIKSLLTTKDGRYLFSSGGGSVNVFDLKKDKLIKTFLFYADQMVFNKAQSKLLLTSGLGIHVLTLADLTLKTIKFEDASAAIFSTDEKSIYSAGRNGPFKINISTGESEMLFTTVFLELQTVKMDNTGKTVYFGGKTKMYSYDLLTKSVTTYPIHNLRDVLPNGMLFTQGFIGAIGEDSTVNKIAFYNPQTKQEVSSIYLSKTYFYNFYNYYYKHFWTFDEKRNILLISTNEEIIQFDFTTNTFSFLPKFPERRVSAFVATANSDIFFVGYGIGNDHLGVQKYHLKENKLMGAIVENIISPYTINAAKHNNGFLASSNVQNKLKYFNLSPSNQKVVVRSWGSNDLDRSKVNGDKISENAMLSPNGKHVIAACDYKKVLMSDAENPLLQKIVAMGKGNNMQQATAFSADSKVAAVFAHNEIQLINTETNQQIRMIATQGKYPNSNEHVGDISPDGSKLYTTYDLLNNNKNHVLAISSTTGLPLWDKELDGNISLVQLNNDGSKLFVGYKSSTVNTSGILLAFNSENGSLISTENYPSRLSNILSMNTSKTMLCTYSNHFGDNESIVWNVKTKEKIFEVPDNPYTMEFLKNDSLLIVSDEDGLKLYNIYTKKELAKIIMYANSDEYIIITPDGLFDGTEKAINAMYFVKNKEIIPLTSFFETYYAPNLLARILSLQPLPIVQNINTLNIQPVVKIQYAENTRNLTVDEDVATYQNTSGVAEITITATAAGDKVDEIRLFHNGKIVNLSTRGLFVTDDVAATETKKYKINLLPGNNNFRAIALNTQRTESKSAEMVVVYADSKDAPMPVIKPINNAVAIDAIDKNATLHLMVVGIDKYQNKAMRLNYAMADAKAFKTEIEKDAASVISNIKTYLVYDDDADKEGIIAALNKVKQNAKAQDVFVFYYAGHGVISVKNKEFYLVPNDVEDLKNVDAVLQQKGISSKELQQYAIDIPAQKQLFLLDACQSAGAFEQLVTNDAGQQKSLANVARSTGTHWIAASGSQQFANEFSSIGHGAFTYVLLQALNGEAASNKMITVNGLKYFLQVQVPALMKKYNGSAQLPSSYGFGNDFPVEVLK